MIKIPANEVAYASGLDLANRRVRAKGGKWTTKDYNDAVVEFHRIHPCPAGVKCELCNPTETSPTFHHKKKIMLLEVSNTEFNTILGALRYYQENGMGEPGNRSDELQEIVCPNDNDTSLSGDEIDELCERLNIENPPTVMKMLAALTRAVDACETHNNGGKLDYDWIGEATDAILAAYAVGLQPEVSADLKRLLMAEIDNDGGDSPVMLGTVQESLAGGYEPYPSFPVEAVGEELAELIVTAGNAPAEWFVTKIDWENRAKQ
jgi:hypothetical protein